MRDVFGIFILILASIGIGFIVADLQGAFTTEAAEVGQAQSILREEVDMVQLTNDYRVTKNLAPLTEDHKLVVSAQEKADTLCRTGEFTHESGGEEFYKPIDRSGYNYKKAGENLAKGFKTTSKAFQGLLDSPSHLANIVDDFREIGVGFNRCEGKNYYVIHYGEK